MILGLIWKLILDFQVKHLPQDKNSMQFTEDDGPKQALLLWCKERLKPYNIEVNNFTTCFQDGVAFLHLYHSMNEKVIDRSKIDLVRQQALSLSRWQHPLLQEKKQENLSLALQIGDSEFGVPKMLDVEDILNDTIDERSVMAYISTIAYNFQVANGLIRSNSGVQMRHTFSNSTSTDELDESDEMQIEDVASFTWEELHIEVHNTLHIWEKKNLSLHQGFLLMQDPSGFLRFWRKKWLSLEGSRLMFFTELRTG